MTQSKNTKRALLASVLSLVLCFTMLIGSTFAWFTDSATTGVNKIVAGNLDIDLYHGTVENDAISYTEIVDKETKLFNDGALWEPGYTEVAYLKVENVGTLALKALFTVNFSNQKTGTSVEGNEIKLSNYLKYDLIEIAEGDYYGTREEARNAAEANAKLIATEQNEIHLEAEAAPKYYALVVYMPETVGNEANYRGNDIPSIDLGVTLIATQDTVESDSWDEQYDKDSEYPSSIENNAGLLEALQSSDNVTIKNGNYELPLTIPEGKTLNVEGGDFAIDANKEGAAFTVNKNANLNISTSNISTEGYKVAVSIQDGGDVTINAGTYVSSSIQVLQISGAGATLTINNGTVKGSSGVWCDSNDAVIVINGGNFNVSALVMGDSVPTTPVFITGGTFKIGAYGFDAYQGTPFVITGGTFNIDPTNYVDTSAYNVVLEEGWYTVTAK